MTEERASCASCGGPICTRRRVRGVPREWETVWTHIRIADAERCAKPEPRREGTAVVDGECPRCGSLVHTEAECDDDPLDDANGYTRSDLLFGGNW